jgi:hypothetical protein
MPEDEGSGGRRVSEGSISAPQVPNTITIEAISEEFERVDQRGRAAVQLIAWHSAQLVGPHLLDCIEGGIGQR